MSWSNVRGAIVTAVEALTPASKKRGGIKYKHVTDEQINDAGMDRYFVLHMTAPPNHLGQFTSPIRYLTQAEITLFYERTRFVSEDEDRIAADVIQIQDVLLDVANHHADFQAIIPIGDVYFTTSVQEDSDGNYIVSLGFAVHHK